MDVPEHTFITWKSKNPLVAAVSEYGYIIGVSAGSTEVIGYANGKKMSAFNIDVSEGEYKQPDLVSYTHCVTIIDGVNDNKEVKLWFDDFGHYTKDPGKADETNNPQPEEEDESDPVNPGEIINTVNFMTPDNKLVRAAKVVSGNLIAAADIPTIGEMPETDEERTRCIGYNPGAWYRDIERLEKFDFATPITEPVITLYPKYMHYHNVAFALTTETNAANVPTDIAAVPDPSLIERQGRVYEGEKIESVTCGIPTEDDFAALLMATGFIRYWLFDKWVKAPETVKVTKDTVVSAYTKNAEHEDAQGLVFRIEANSLGSLDDDVAKIVRVKDETALKAKERIDIPEEVSGAAIDRDGVKTFLDSFLDADGDHNVYDDGWYYYQYSYYRHHDENDLRYVINKNYDAVVLRADEEKCIENTHRDYYHIENAEHEGTLSNNNVIDTDRSETAYLTPQLERLGYDVALRVADIQVHGPVYVPAKNDGNTDFYLDRTRHTDAYRKIYKDRESGYIFYIDDGEDLDDTDDDVAIIVINPGNGGSEDETNIPGNVTVEDVPPRTVPVGGYVEPGDDPDGAPVVNEVLRENGYIFAKSEDNKSKILSFINAEVSLATSANKIADWDRDAFIARFGVSEDVIPRNALWVGNAEHMPVLGGGDVQSRPSEQKITAEMEGRGQDVATRKKNINGDTTWYLHKGYGTHPLPDTESTNPNNGEADVYNRIYKDASGYLFIIDDPTEDTDPNPVDDDRAVLVGFVDPEDGPEVISRPTRVDDPRTEEVETGDDMIPVVPEPKGSSTEEGEGEDDPDNDPDNGGEETDKYWTDPETGEKYKKHCFGDIVFILKDTDHDSVNEAVVIGVNPPSCESDIEIPVEVTDDNDPQNMDPGHQYDVVRILERAVNQMYPSAAINVKANKAPGAGVSPAEIYGNLVYEGEAGDGSYIYRRCGFAGNIVYVADTDHSAKVIGADSNRYAYGADTIYVPETAVMTVSGNEMPLMISEELEHAFDGEGTYQYDVNDSHYITPNAPVFYNDLPSAIVVLGDESDVYHAPGPGGDRAPSGIGIYDGTQTSDKCYWKKIGERTYMQVYELGQFYVAYGDNDRRTIIGWYGLSNAGMQKGADLLFDVGALKDKNQANFSQSMISNDVFLKNDTATFSFMNSETMQPLSEVSSRRLLGVRTENVNGVEREVKFFNIYTKNNKRTYVRTLMDSIYEYVLKWDEENSTTKSVITGLIDPSKAGVMANGLYETLTLPASIGIYPLDSVADGAFKDANDGKSVAEMKGSVPFGKDVIKDTQTKYTMAAPLGEKYGISGYYEDGLKNSNGTSMSQTYMSGSFNVKDADRNTTFETVSYQYKYVHPASIARGGLTLAGSRQSGEELAIITDIDFTNFATQGRSGICYLPLPEFVPDNSSNDALVIAVDENVRKQIKRMMNLSGRDIRFDTPLPNPGLPEWVDPETGEIIINATVTILVRGERGEGDLRGAGFDDISELDGSLRTSSTEQALNDRPGFTKEFNGKNAMLNDQLDEMQDILYGAKYHDRNDWGSQITAKNLGFVSPRLYEMRKDDATGEYRSTGASLSVSGNTAVEGDSVYELRFERDTYEITEIVKIVQAESTQTLNMGTFKVKNGADLSHLGTTASSGKQYYSLQWFSDSDMNNRFENTLVTSSSPAVAGDGKRYIYGKLGGSRYNIKLDTNTYAGTNVSTGAKENVKWSLNGSTTPNWLTTDATGTYGKPGTSGSDRSMTIYGYYNEPIGYYYKSVLKGAALRIPDGSKIGSTTIADQPTMDHYDFAGWYTKNGTKVTSNFTLTSGVSKDDGYITSSTDDGITLYAKWAGKKSTITFDRKGNTTATASVTATYNQNMPAITKPSWTGYTFGGYYDSNNTQYYKADGTSARKWDRTAATTLTAKKTANTYTVTLNKNKGSGSTTPSGGTSSTTATYDANMPAITVPSRTGYTFKGYYDTSAATGGTQYYTATGASARTWDKAANTTLYARWEGDPVTITFNPNGGRWRYRTDGVTGDAYTSTTTTITGTATYDSTYGNACYDDPVNNCCKIVNIGSTDNRKYRRYYLDRPDTYEFPSGGSHSYVGTPDSDDITTEYAFDGWYTAATGGTKITSSSTVTGSRTLYAHWLKRTETAKWVYNQVYMYVGEGDADYSSGNYTYWGSAIGPRSNANGSTVADSNVQVASWSGSSNTDYGYFTYSASYGSASCSLYYDRNVVKSNARDIYYWVGIVDSTAGVDKRSETRRPKSYDQGTDFTVSVSYTIPSHLEKTGWTNWTSA